MIERQGHEVILVNDGKEAIEVYKEYFNGERSIDVLIMDLTIPGSMGGKEAVKGVLQIDPAAQVIVSSGYSNDPVLADYEAYGFKASIAKPFTLGELKKVINSVLNAN